jgi:hypothetical protein
MTYAEKWWRWPNTFAVVFANVSKQPDPDSRRLGGCLGEFDRLSSVGRRTVRLV